ncbi:MAG: NAD-dependent epimerase/dehydratase family protein [Mycobacterium leprae]
MRVLVAGGSRFIGRHLVELLLSEGHEVTLFNRGRTNPGLFPGVHEVHGDRQEPPAVLGSESWDWVFDLSCYTPQAADKLIRTVAPRTGRYIFCSTCSVYEWDGSVAPLSEESPRYPTTPENLNDEADPGIAYGARKAAAEDVLFRLSVESGMEATIVRPCLVYGPWDTSDRLHWWLHRVQAGKVVVPRERKGMVHAVYVKDLARIFMAAAKAPHASGRVYHGAAIHHATLYDWIATAARVVGREPLVAEVPDQELKAAGALELPGLFGQHDFAFTTARLEQDFGFTSTPFIQTLAESLEHMNREGRPIKEAVDPALLDQWLA